MRIREGFISAVRWTWVLQDGGDVNRHVGEGEVGSKGGLGGEDIKIIEHMFQDKTAHG